MDGTTIVIISILAGAAPVVLFALKSLLDQLPEVIDATTRARRAWEKFVSGSEEEPEPDRRDEQPPVD